MDYKIIVNKTKPTGKKSWSIDNIRCLLMPIAICMGVGGDKAARFKAHLEKTLAGNRDLLYVLCSMHEHGITNGEVVLVCDCPMRKYHSQAIIAFLQENAEALKAMFPYVLPGYISKTKQELPPATSASEIGLIGKEPEGDLIYEDLGHTERLIATTAENGLTHLDELPFIEGDKISADQALHIGESIEYARAGVEAPVTKTVPIVPIYRKESSDKFVDPAVIPPYVVDVNGIEVVTSVLATGVRFDLLGISQSAGLLEAGVIDVTDTIDPAITLNSIYLQLGNGQVVKFESSRFPLSCFASTERGNYRTMSLSFKTANLQLTKDTRAIDGEELSFANELAEKDYVVRIETHIFGTANLELGAVEVFGRPLILHNVEQGIGNFLEKTDPAISELADIIGRGKVIGYDLASYRYNPSRTEVSA